MASSILASGLVKRYGDVRALDGLDLEVPTGTVLGLLGPNGAGKSTAVRILTTLVRPNAGSCSVAGIDVLRYPDQVRGVIGLAGQHASVDEDLTGQENLEMVGRLHHLGRPRSRARAAELLELFSLQDVARQPVKTYSGGTRRRLDLAAALLAAPPVLFLDEPTTGLDPQGRREMWDTIRDLAHQGTTIMLTTQYLEEADQLSSTVVVIDHGRVIAKGSAAELKARLASERLQVTLASTHDVAAMTPYLTQLGTGTPVVDPADRTVTIAVADGISALCAAVRLLDNAGIRPVDLAVQRASLDDVFLQLTVRNVQQNPADPVAPGEPVTDARPRPHRARSAG